MQCPHRNIILETETYTQDGLTKVIQTEQEYPKCYGIECPYFKKKRKIGAGGKCTRKN